MPSTPSSAKPVDYVARNVGVAIDRRGIDAFMSELAHFGDRLIDSVLSFRRQGRIGENQRAIKVPKEQRLGKAERLRPGEEQFLGFLLLLGQLSSG